MDLDKSSILSNLLQELILIAHKIIMDDGMIALDKFNSRRRVLPYLFYLRYYYRLITYIEESLAISTNLEDKASLSLV